MATNAKPGTIAVAAPATETEEQEIDDEEPTMDQDTELRHSHHQLRSISQQDEPKWKSSSVPKDKLELRPNFYAHKWMRGRKGTPE